MYNQPISNFSKYYKGQSIHVYAFIFVQMKIILMWMTCFPLFHYLINQVHSFVNGWKGTHICKKRFSRVMTPTAKIVGCHYSWQVCVFSDTSAQHTPTLAVPTTLSPHAPLGCYAAHSIFSLSCLDDHHHYDHQKQSRDKCVKNCKRHKFTYAGLQVTQIDNSGFKIDNSLHIFT